jgi:hypothetical protein
MTTETRAIPTRRNINDRRAVDTTTPLDTLGKAPLAELPEPPAFTRADARRPVDRPSAPCLQWATGLPTKDRKVYAGWLVEAGKDADLDAAMADADISQVTIKHGSGNLVTHWAMPVASLFVVCDGVQTFGEMRDTPDRYGIAFGWRTVGASGIGSGAGRMQSVLRARVFVQELCAVGYTQPLILSLKGTLTGDLLGCLIRHYAVLDSINPIRRAAGKEPIAVPYYAVALRLGAGDEVQRGSAGQSKEITPMVEIGPRDRDYVLAHWCKRPWVEAIEALCDETILWSRAQSIKIASGDESREEWE